MVDPAPGRQLFHVVASVAVERGYPSDPLSLAREAVDFTTHRDAAEALARLFTELDADLAEGAALALRRSYLIEAAIPDVVLAAGCPRRWVSDRATRLLQGVGAKPGEYWRAVERGTLPALLSADLAEALGALSAALREGAGRGPGGVSALSLRAAGAAFRAQHNGAAPEPLARRIASVARAIGTAAWDGQDAGYLAPALDALLSEAAPGGPPSGPRLLVEAAPLVASPLPAAQPVPAARNVAADNGYGMAGLLASLPPFDWEALERAAEPVGAGSG